MKPTLTFIATWLTFSQSHHWLARVSERFNLNIFAIKFIQLRDWKTHQRFMLKGGFISIQKKLETLDKTSCAIFQQPSNKLANLHSLLSRNLKMSLDPCYRNAIFSLMDFKTPPNIPTHNYVYHFVLNFTRIASFEKFDFRGDQFVLAGIFNLISCAVYCIYNNRLHIASKCEFLKLTLIFKKKELFRNLAKTSRNIQPNLWILF